MRLTTSVSVVDGWTVVGVGGDLDLASAPELRNLVVGLVANGSSRIVLDLGGVEFCDSTGLGVLVGALKRVRVHDGDLRLARVNPRVRRVFEVTDLTRVFTCYPSVAEAVR